VLAVLAMSEHRGPHSLLTISYANSGDTALGDLDRVVGYGAVAVVAGDGYRYERPMPRDVAAGGPLTGADRQRLLAFARDSILRYLTTETAPLARGLGVADDLQRGAFVTLKKDGHLRGCIGHMAEDRPLGQVVGAMALQAAFNDRRFEPVSLRELPALEIEISVLTPRQRAAGPEAIRVGVDGVYLEKDGRSAVFLPQVAPEQGWDRDQLLDALCRKAGLPAGAWREGAELETFQALVFAESDSP
jgi:AmmeMemoRadiSam system protein A